MPLIVLVDPSSIVKTIEAVMPLMVLLNPKTSGTAANPVAKTVSVMFSTVPEVAVPVHSATPPLILIEVNRLFPGMPDQETDIEATVILIGPEFWRVMPVMVFPVRTLPVVFTTK